MAVPIITPTVIRGQLMFVTGNVAVPDLKTALCAWSAVEALQNERTAALAVMRKAGSDMAAFREASRNEAQLAARIRRLRRAGGVQ